MLSTNLGLFRASEEYRAKAVYVPRVDWSGRPQKCGGAFTVHQRIQRIDKPLIHVRSLLLGQVGFRNRKGLEVLLWALIVCVGESSRSTQS